MRFDLSGLSEEERYKKADEVFRKILEMLVKNKKIPEMIVEHWDKGSVSVQSYLPMIEEDFLDVGAYDFLVHFLMTDNRVKHVHVEEDKNCVIFVVEWDTPEDEDFDFD